jgi:hypothetical protein
VRQICPPLGDGNILDGAGFILRQEDVPASASLEKTYRGFVHVDAERLLLCGNLRDAIIPPLPRRASLAVGSRVVCMEWEWRKDIKLRAYKFTCKF